LISVQSTENHIIHCENGSTEKQTNNVWLQLFVPLYAI